MTAFGTLGHLASRATERLEAAFYNAVFDKANRGKSDRIKWFLVELLCSEPPFNDFSRVSNAMVLIFIFDFIK